MRSCQPNDPDGSLVTGSAGRADEQPPADRCGRDCGAVSGSSDGLRRRRCRDPRSFGRRTGLRSRGVGCGASATRNVLVRVRRLWRFRREVEGWKLGGTSVHLGGGRRETARIRSAERCAGMTATAPVSLMRSPTAPTEGLVRCRERRPWFPRVWGARRTPRPNVGSVRWVLACAFVHSDLQDAGDNGYSGLGSPD